MGVIGAPRGVAGLAGTVLPPEIGRRLLAFPSQGYNVLLLHERLQVNMELWNMKGAVC